MCEIRHHWSIARNDMLVSAGEAGRADNRPLLLMPVRDSTTTQVANREHALRASR